MFDLSSEANRRTASKQKVIDSGDVPINWAIWWQKGADLYFGEGCL